MSKLLTNCAGDKLLVDCTGTKLLITCPTICTDCSPPLRSAYHIKIEVFLGMWLLADEADIISDGFCWWEGLSQRNNLITLSYNPGGDNWLIGGERGLLAFSQHCSPLVNLLEIGGYRVTIT